MGPSISYTMLLILLASPSAYIPSFSTHWVEKTSCTYGLSSTKLDADIIIGALFPMHHYQLGKYNINIISVAWVESFLFAIEQINKNKDLLPNTVLGYIIKDTCNNVELALHHALDFMVDVKYYRNDENCQQIPPSHNQSLCQCSRNKYNIIRTIIGCKSSTISGEVAMLLSADFTPQISPLSSSQTLGDKDIYPNFLRTLPSDIFQTSAIIDLLKHFNWTYVSVLASDSDYGRFALDDLVEKMKGNGMCPAVEKIFDPAFPLNDMEKLINQLKEKYEKSNVVVLWCHISDAITIISRTHEAGLKNITWIGTEIWGTHNELRLLKSIITDLRLISLALQSKPVPAFKKHFSRIGVKSNLQNPWFAPLWKALGICKTPDSKHCTMILPTNQHENVMYSVYAVAYGLHSYLNCTKAKCANKTESFDNNILLQHIKNVSFMLPSTNSTFTFNSKGDKTFTSYKYKIFYPRPSKKPNKFRYAFMELGHWDGKSHTYKIEMDVFEKAWGNRSKPQATCSFQCNPGFYRVNSSVSCCWKCLECASNQISTMLNQPVCQKCSKTEISNEENTVCISLVNLGLSINTSSGQLIVAFSSLGIVSMLAILAVFLKHWNSPVVKSSSREISILQLAYILTLFCLPVLDLVELTETICIIKMTLFGTLYSQIISFIVIKTYRLYCVFNTKQFTQLSKYLKNRYQFLFSFILVIPEITGIGIWYTYVKHDIKMEIMQKKKAYIYHCGDTEDLLLYGLIAYIVLLSIIGGFMAFRARKLPENFKETQFIFLAMFTTCLAWTSIFLPLYLSMSYDRKEVVFLCVNMVSTFCLLYILYGYKVIIIIVYPEFNSKEHFRKMATTNTMLSFLKDIDPVRFSNHRVSQNTVLDIDFDALFDRYREEQMKKSFTIPKPKLSIRATIKRIDKHMASFRKRNSSEPTISSCQTHKSSIEIATLSRINNLAADEIMFQEAGSTIANGQGRDNVVKRQCHSLSVLEEIDSSRRKGKCKHSPSCMSDGIQCSPLYKIDEEVFYPFTSPKTHKIPELGNIDANRKLSSDLYQEDKKKYFPTYYLTTPDSRPQSPSQKKRDKRNYLSPTIQNYDQSCPLSLSSDGSRRSLSLSNYDSRCNAVPSYQNIGKKYSITRLDSYDNHRKSSRSELLGSKSCPAYRSPPSCERSANILQLCDNNEKTKTLSLRSANNYPTNYAYKAPIGPQNSNTKIEGGPHDSFSYLINSDSSDKKVT